MPAQQILLWIFSHSFSGLRSRESLEIPRPLVSGTETLKALSASLVWPAKGSPTTSFRKQFWRMRKFGIWCQVTQGCQQPLKNQGSSREGLCTWWVVTDTAAATRPLGLSSGGLTNTIDICKMTHLDTRAPCWWSMSGLAESQESQWRGAKLGEGSQRAWGRGIPLVHWNPFVKGRENSRKLVGNHFSFDIWVRRRSTTDR